MKEEVKEGVNNSEVPTGDVGAIAASRNAVGKHQVKFCGKGPKDQAPPAPPLP